LNWWLAGAFGSDFWGALEHLPPAWYLWHDDRYLPVLAERWGFSGDTFSFTLRSGLRWSNGQSLTSRDERMAANRLYRRLGFELVVTYTYRLTP